MVGMFPAAFHRCHVIIAVTLWLRHDYVTDGETKPLRIQLLGQGHLAIMQQDLGMQVVWLQLHILNHQALLHPKQPPLVRSALFLNLPLLDSVGLSDSKSPPLGWVSDFVTLGKCADHYRWRAGSKSEYCYIFSILTSWNLECIL